MKVLIILAAIIGAALCSPVISDVRTMYGVDSDDASPRNVDILNVNDDDNAANLADQINNDSDSSNEEVVVENIEPQSADVPNVFNDDGPIVFDGQLNDQQTIPNKPDTDVLTAPRQDFTVLNQGTYIPPNETPNPQPQEPATYIPPYQPAVVGNALEVPKQDFTILSTGQFNPEPQLQEQPSKPYPAQQSDDGYHYDRPSVQLIEGDSRADVVQVEVEQQEMIELPTVYEYVQADKPYPPRMDYLPPQEQMPYFMPHQQESQHQMDYLPPNQYNQY